jgi:hypothetical protein
VSEPVTPAPASTVAEFSFPHLEGPFSFDCALVPPDTRLDFLKGALRAYIANRLNGVHTRHEKDPVVAAWSAYDEAQKSDPMQSLVPVPTTPRPAAPNYQEAYDRAIADLIAGNVRRVGDEPKARKVKDPLVATVTDAVVREVYKSRRAADPKYTFLAARKEVGPDGIQYLNDAIEARVAAGADRAALEKSRDTRYINPAKAILGLTTAKGQSDLPSVL